MKRILILGPGCSMCKVLAIHAEQAVAELGIECEIEKITDLNVIMGYRVMSTPGLVVDGELKFSGRVPSVEQLKELLS